MMAWIVNLDYAASGTPDGAGPGPTAGAMMLFGIGRMLILGTLLYASMRGGVL